MIAKRLDEYTPSEKHSFYYYKQEGIWYLNIPECGLANLAGHAVVENDDGTITVTPSILTTGYSNERMLKVTRHGFLTNSVWSEA